jgi:O-acetyl-ADP-ribose deacetylase (regulator of RNase III)
VDGAIHNAGGPEIMRELDEIRRKSGGCPTGSAVVTAAGKLPASYVFHAVGPVYHGGTRREPELLAACYRKCLELAEEHGVKTISFPAISTGAYRYPLAAAADIAVREVEAHFERPGIGLQRAVFVVFGKAAYKVYAKRLGLAAD